MSERREDVIITWRQIGDVRMMPDWWRSTSICCCLCISVSPFGHHYLTKFTILRFIVQYAMYGSTAGIQMCSNSGHPPVFSDEDLYHVSVGMLMADQIDLCRLHLFFRFKPFRTLLNLFFLLVILFSFLYWAKILRWISVGSTPCAHRNVTISSMDVIYVWFRII